MNLVDAYRELQIRLNRLGFYSEFYGILLNQMKLQISVTEDAWSPPGGRFDPEILIEPGVLSNVVDGFGVVGGGYHVEPILFSPFTDLGRLESKFPSAALAAARFLTEQPNSVFCPPPTR